MWGALSNAVYPVGLGMALALAFNVPLRGIERLLPIANRAVRRTLALCITFGLAAVLAAMLVWAALPRLSAVCVSLFADIPRLIASLPLPEQAKALLQNLDLFEKQQISGLLGAGFNAAASLASWTVQFGTALVLCIYLLARKEILARHADMLVRALWPRQAQHLRQIGARAAQIFGSFVAGQFLEACILAALFAVVLLVCRMPYALACAGIIGGTALVPVFGAFLGAFISSVLVYSVRPDRVIFFLILFLCVQQLENSLIYPRVVGSRVGLPALWVLAAVTVGGRLAGVVGMFCTIPLVSVVYHVGGELVRERLVRQRRKE